MSIRRRAARNLNALNLGVNYGTRAAGFRVCRDALNFVSVDKVGRTRNGSARHNSTALDAKAESLSFFKQRDGTRELLAKQGTQIDKVAESGAHTKISGSNTLTASTRHRGVTIGRRHFIGDPSGLYWYDGTNFAAAGQSAPAAPTVAAGSSGNTLPASTYRVAYSYVASSIGYETNIGAESSQVVIASGERIEITGMSTSATHPLIDKKRIYVRDVSASGALKFYAEIAIATAAHNVNSEVISSVVPYERNAVYPSGGAKYVEEFDKRLVASGNSNNQDIVYLSETDLPEAFSDTIRPNDTLTSQIYVPGDGPVTGLKTGLYDNDKQRPYLCIFKEASTHIFTESDGLVTISDTDGSVGQDTIFRRNGDIIFLSREGWRAIENGRLLTNQDDSSLNLGHIDDIFKRRGWQYAANQTNMDDWFTVYYPTLDYAMTFSSLEGNTRLDRVYAYEFESAGFKPFSFPINANCGALGEDSNGAKTVFFADDTGYIFSHSVNSDYNDRDASNNKTEIKNHFILAWEDAEDIGSSYQWLKAVLRGVESNKAITCKWWTNYDLGTPYSEDVDWTGTSQGFRLDVSQLDIGAFGDDREKKRAEVDLRTNGFNLSFGVFQDSVDSAMEITNIQLNFRKCGNRNVL